MIHRLLPLAATIRGYRAAAARRDLTAGITVALFTIPQAMAYALIAGVPPAAGLFGAAAASILGAAFGSSELLVNGPTNAISVMMAASAPLLAGRADRIATLTWMVGLVQLAAAALRLGRFSRLLSWPVMTGFTAGAGIYVAANQMPALLGLDPQATAVTLWGWVPPRDCLFDLARAALRARDANPAAVAVGLGTFALIRALQRIGRRLPAPFLAIVAATLACAALGLGDAERGAFQLRLVRDIAPLARRLPILAWPSLDPAEIGPLLSTAIAVALLGSVEAIAISKLLAAKAGHAFDASQQIFGEAMGNLGAAVVGGFASSGSFTRSAVNHEAGAATRLSSVYAGLLVIVVLLAAAPAANHIPLAALAGTLVHVGLKLVDVSKIRQAMATTSGDRAALLAALAGVILLPALHHALFAGILVSLFSALRRAEGFKVVRLRETSAGHLVEAPLAGPSGEVVAVDLQGELFFAAAEELTLRLKEILSSGARFVVVRLGQAYNLDATCVEALGDAARAARAAGGALILADVREGMYATLERAGLIAVIGAESVLRLDPEPLRATREALAHAHRLAAVRKS